MTTLKSDSLVRANENPIAAPWREPNFLSNGQLLSNAYAGVSTADPPSDASYFDDSTGTLPVDGWCEFVVVDAANCLGGPKYRCDANGGGYEYLVSTGAVNRLSATGVRTNIDTRLSGTIANGDIFRLECVGAPTAIKIYRKPSGGSYTQVGTTITGESSGPQVAGFAGVASGGAAHLFTSFAAGNMTGEPPGGTPSQNLAASCTPAATLVNRPLQTLVASVTPVATEANLPLQALAASVTPAGSLGNVAGGAGSQTLTASVTPSAVLINRPLQVLTASVAITAALPLSVPGQTLLASVAPGTELDLLVFVDSLAATVQPTASLSNQATITQSLGASVQPTAALSNIINTQLAASVTPAGSLVNRPLQSLSASVTPVGALTNQAGGAAQQTLVASVVPSTTLVNRPLQILSAGLLITAQLLGVTPPDGGAGVAGQIATLKKRKSAGE